MSPTMDCVYGFIFNWYGEGSDFKLNDDPDLKLPSKGWPSGAFLRHFIEYVLLKGSWGTPPPPLWDQK